MDTLNFARLRGVTGASRHAETPTTVTLVWKNYQGVGAENWPGRTEALTTIDKWFKANGYYTTLTVEEQVEKDLSADMHITITWAKSVYAEKPKKKIRPITDQELKSLETPDAFGNMRVSAAARKAGVRPQLVHGAIKRGKIKKNADGSVKWADVHAYFVTKESR